MFERLGLRLAGTERVLDVGCGDGSYAGWLSARARSTVGIDRSAHPEWPRLSGPTLRFQEADAHALPFGDMSFDLVFIKDVLHHVDDPTRVLQELRRVTAPGGTVCIVECNRYNPISYPHMTLMLNHQHFRRPVFKRLVVAVFPTARFLRWESHVYPIHSPALVRLSHLIERLVVKTPLVERLASHNAALATV